MNKYQFKAPTSTGLGTSYYYCYGDNSFENYLNLKNIKYKKLTDDGRSGRNLINEKDKEIERLNQEIRSLNNCIIEFHSEFCNKQAEINRLNNIINEIEAIIYNNQITGIELRLEIQERLDKVD